MRLRGLCPCPVLVKSFEEHSRGTSFDEALQNFYWLFVNVARLNGMDREAELAALGAKPPKNPYPNIEAARQGLHQDPLYRWLKRKLPQTIPHARAPTDSPSTESRFVLNLLSLLIQLARPKSRKAPHKRPDKHRATLAKSVARLERGLVDGTIRPTVAKRALLGQLKTELTTKRAKLVPPGTAADCAGTRVARAERAEVAARDRASRGHYLIPRTKRSALRQTRRSSRNGPPANGLALARRT